MNATFYLTNLLFQRYEKQVNYHSKHNLLSPVKSENVSNGTFYLNVFLFIAHHKNRTTANIAHVYSEYSQYLSPNRNLVSRARPFTDSCSPGRKGLVTHAHTFGAPGML